VKIEGDMDFLELANVVLKQILKILFFMEIVPFFDKGRYHFGGKQKLQNLLQNKIRELKKKTIAHQICSIAKKFSPEVDINLIQFPLIIESRNLPQRKVGLGFLATQVDNRPN